MGNDVQQDFSNYFMVTTGGQARNIQDINWTLI